MNKKQKQELFDAITSIGYKETETKILQYLAGEVVEQDEKFMTILSWFNVWYNKGEYLSEMQCVVSFIQTNTYTNPSNNNKSKKKKIIDEDFKKRWLEKFGVEVKEDSYSINLVDRDKQD